MAEGYIEAGREFITPTYVNDKIESCYIAYSHGVVSIYILGKMNQTYTHGELLVTIPENYRPVSNDLVKIYNSAGTDTGNVSWASYTGSITFDGSNPAGNKIIITHTYVK